MDGLVGNESGVNDNGLYNGMAKDIGKVNRRILPAILMFKNLNTINRYWQF